MDGIACKTRRCPTDPADEEWQRIQPLLPKVPSAGRQLHGGGSRVPVLAARAFDDPRRFGTIAEASLARRP
jgi:hypothetical protein